MADILNLRRFRKAQRRSESEALASSNRAAFGRSKQERAAAKAATDQATRLLDGHRRVSSAPGTPDQDGPDG